MATVTEVFLGKVMCLQVSLVPVNHLFVPGNIVKNAPRSRLQVVLFDPENALDEVRLQALDVDTSPDKLLRISVLMITM